MTQLDEMGININMATRFKIAMHCMRLNCFRRLRWQK